MLFKKMMAGLIGILFVACLGQALFIFHFRDFDQFSRIFQRPTGGTGDQAGSGRLLDNEKSMSSNAGTADPTLSKLDVKQEKQETPHSMPALAAKQGDSTANPPIPETFRLVVHDHLLATSQTPSTPALSHKQETPLLLTKTSLLDVAPPMGTAKSRPENSLAPPALENLSTLPPLAGSKDSEFPSPPPAPKSLPDLPTAIPFPAANVSGGSTAEPPIGAASAAPVALGAPISFLPAVPQAKTEDAAATLARVHKEMAELMSPEELQKAVTAATAQLQERKKRKEKERKEQAAHTALEKAKTALKQISSEFPDTDAGKKASQFLQSLENPAPAFPGLVPASPTSLELLPLAMALTR